MATNYNPSAFPDNVAIQVIVDASHTRTGEVFRDIKDGGFVAVRYSNVFGKRDQDSFNTYADAVRFAGGGEINPSPVDAFKALESLNVEICREAGLGEAKAAGFHGSTYLTYAERRNKLLASRADEVRAAIAAARKDMVRGHGAYIDGMEASLARAIDTPRQPPVEVEPAAQTVYVLEGEHFSQPGRIVKVYASEADATREAVELVNIQVSDTGWRGRADASNWQEWLERLQDRHGAQYCHVGITAHDIVGATR